MIWQIILPMVLTTILCIAAVVLVNIATFRDNGDVARWAAISTMWIVIPIMIGMVIFLVLLGGLIYLMAQLLNIAPIYTDEAQDYVNIGVGYIKRAMEAMVKPVIGLNGILAGITAFFEKIKP